MAAKPKDITQNTVAWAQQHDWYYCVDTMEDRALAIWVLENGKIHPWPFLNEQELRAWAGY